MRKDSFQRFQDSADSLEQKSFFIKKKLSQHQKKANCKKTIKELSGMIKTDPSILAGKGDNAQKILNFEKIKKRLNKNKWVFYPLNQSYSKEISEINKLRSIESKHSQYNSDSKKIFSNLKKIYLEKRRQKEQDTSRLELDKEVSKCTNNFDRKMKNLILLTKNPKNNSFQKSLNLTLNKSNYHIPLSSSRSRIKPRKRLINQN